MAQKETGPKIRYCPKCSLLMTRLLINIDDNTLYAIGTGRRIYHSRFDCPVDDIQIIDKNQVYD